MTRRPPGRLVGADNGEGLSLAIADAGSDDALGAVVLLFRRQPGTVEIGYWLVERARGRRAFWRASASGAKGTCAPIWLSTRADAFIYSLPPSDLASRPSITRKLF